VPTTKPPRQRPTKAVPAARKPRSPKVVHRPDRGRVRVADESLTEAELQGPFEPYQLYHLTEIHEGLGIRPAQARRWLYNGTLPYVKFNGNVRRLRGRDLNRFINDRVIAGDR
jgi:hypothetical protein